MSFHRFWRDAYGTHFSLKLFGLEFQCKLNATYKTAKAFGIRNNTVDGKRVPFFDYDDTLLDFLIPELEILQKKYMLSDFYIFKSSQKENGYHVLGLDKLPYKEWLHLIDESSCDEYYRVMPITNDHRSWVLRVSQKAESRAPRLLRVLHSKYQLRPKSRAHALFLNKYHGVNIKNLRGLDHHKILYTIKYETLNFIKKGESLK